MIVSIYFPLELAFGDKFFVLSKEESILHFDIIKSDSYFSESSITFCHHISLIICANLFLSGIMLNEVAMGRLYSVLAEYNLTMQQFNALNIYTGGKLVEMLGQPGRDKEEDRLFLQVNIPFLLFRHWSLILFFLWRLFYYNR